MSLRNVSNTEVQISTESGFSSNHVAVGIGVGAGVITAIAIAIIFGPIAGISFLVGGIAGWCLNQITVKNLNSASIGSRAQEASTKRVSISDAEIRQPFLVDEEAVKARIEADNQLRKEIQASLAEDRRLMDRVRW